MLLACKVNGVFHLSHSSVGCSGAQPGFHKSPLEFHFPDANSFPDATRGAMSTWSKRLANGLLASGQWSPDHGLLSKLGWRGGRAWCKKVAIC